MRWWIAALAAAGATGFLVQEYARSLEPWGVAETIKTLAMVPGMAVAAALLCARAMFVRRRTPVAPEEVYVDAIYRSEGGLDALSFGHDEGILCEVDGWLHFRGRHGEWSLSRNDASHFQQSVWMGRGDRKIVINFVELSGSSGKVKEILAGWETAPIPPEPPSLPVFHRRWPWLHAVDGAMLAAALMFGGLTMFAFLGPDVHSKFWLVPFVPTAAALGGLTLSIRKRRRRWARWQATDARADLASPRNHDETRVNA